MAVEEAIVADSMPGTVVILAEEATWVEVVITLIPLVVKSTLEMFVLEFYFTNFQLAYTTSWQDLKDLFRAAGRTAHEYATYLGNVLRSDINLGPDGRSKGSGIILFETVADAQNAIQQFNGYEFNGRHIDVREDRFAGAVPRQNFAGGYGGGGYGRGGYGSGGGSYCYPC